MAEDTRQYLSPDVIQDMIRDLKKRMEDAAKKLKFEEAARFRDEIKELEQEELYLR